MSPEISRAFKLSIPTLIAYFPLGLTFGLLFTNAGYHWWLAPIMSALVYAGAVQFVALSMMTTLHSGFLAVFLATLFVALRNSFYGLTFLERYQTHWLKKGILIFLLVDANYVTLMHHPPEKSENDLRFCFYLSLFMYLAWVLGTLFGALFSRYLPMIHGLNFILTAFFMVLVVEYYLSNRQMRTIIMPLLAAFIAYLLTPNHFLLVGILISVALIWIIHLIEKRKAHG